MTTIALALGFVIVIAWVLLPVIGFALTMAVIATMFVVVISAAVATYCGIRSIVCGLRRKEIPQ